MTEIELMIRVSMLPPNLKEEVSDFVDFLLNKYVDQNQQKMPLQFGMMTGFSGTEAIPDESLEEYFPEESLTGRRKSESDLDD